MEFQGNDDREPRKNDSGRSGSGSRSFGGGSGRSGGFGGQRSNSGGPRRSFGGQRSSFGGHSGGDGGFRGRSDRFSGPRSTEKFKAICTECKAECEVPFEPTPGKSVYCNECFKKHRKF